MRSAAVNHEAGATSDVTILRLGQSAEIEGLCQAVGALGFSRRVVDSVESLSVVGCAGSRLLVIAVANQDVSKEILFCTLAQGGVPTLAIFVLSACDVDDDIVEMCTDFTTWPCHGKELSIRLANLLGAHGPNPEGYAFESIVEKRIASEILGRAPAIQLALDSIRKFASCDAPVLVEGETGTGKELASRAIHYLSARRNHPFMPVTCGAIPDNLLENELFGHERGAYTDAKSRQPGLVAQAQGGTLFLDEVDTLSPRVQAAILRFLESREYRPLGCGSTRTADVRIIAATNVDLQGLVSRHQFRSDLYFRLNVLSVRMPPLVDRSSDIRLLAEHFVQEYSRLYRKPMKVIHPETMDWMERYRWPGNIRELQNLIQRECLLASGPVLRIDDRANPEAGAEHKGRVHDEPGSFRTAKASAIQTFEERYLHWLMAECGGNVTRAARKAGKERRSLGKLLKKYGIGQESDGAASR